MELQKLRTENTKLVTVISYQSVQSVAGKLSCKRTALKRCTKIEILWYRKMPYYHSVAHECVTLL